MQRAGPHVKGGSKGNYCPTQESRIPIIFLLSRARPTQQKTREGGHRIPGRRLTVTVPSAGLTKEAGSRSHAAEGWYTTDRHASWKRPVAIRNPSLAPTFQMKPFNFPFPSPKLLPGNLPCPPVVGEDQMRLFPKRQGSPPLPAPSCAPTGKGSRRSTPGASDLQPPPPRACDILCRMRVREVKVEGQTC